MTKVLLELPDTIFPLSYPRKMNVEEFQAFCFANPELIIEREADGTLKIMSPVSLNSGNREGEIITELFMYARQHGGKAFSSSTGFLLPDSSIRSPDACFVSAQQLQKFSKEELDHFAPIVPEFIVEILSPTDKLAELEEKMRKAWIGNGVKLAWLIDVDADKLWIYRANGTVELVTPLEGTVSGEDVLPEFFFDLQLLS